MRRPRAQETFSCTRPSFSRGRWPEKKGRIRCCTVPSTRYVLPSTTFYTILPLRIYLLLFQSCRWHLYTYAKMRTRGSLRKQASHSMCIKAHLNQYALCFRHSHHHCPDVLPFHFRSLSWCCENSSPTSLHNNRRLTHAAPHTNEHTYVAVLHHRLRVLNFFEPVQPTSSESTPCWQRQVVVATDSSI